MAVWRLQVNTGGTNVADYCLKNHVAAMGWSLRELTQAERSGIHTFLDYCNLARTQYKSFDSVCRMVEDVKEGDLLWMRSRNEGKYYIARVKANSTWVFREDAVQIDAANQLTNIDWYPATDKADEESVPGAVATSFIMGSTIQRIKKMEWKHTVKCCITVSTIQHWIYSIIPIQLSRYVRSIFTACFSRKMLRIYLRCGCMIRKATFAFHRQIKLLRQSMSAFWLIQMT